MAVTYNVAGPLTTITYAGSALGEGDGEFLASIEEDVRYAPVPTDQFGGEAADWVQRVGYDVVSLRLIRYDRAVLNTLRGVLYDNAGTIAVAPSGKAPTAGLLKLADRPAGSTSLVIAGTKLTSPGNAESAGMVQYTWARAILDPDKLLTLERIGWDVTRVPLVFRCLPDSSGNIRTEASIT